MSALVTIKVLPDGDLDIADLEMWLKNHSKYFWPTPIVTIVGASNEIGTIRDIKSISYIVHKYDGLLHVDAVQLFGETKLDVRELGIDLMSVSGHKIGTPAGIGFLYINKDIVKHYSPIISGNQEQGLRGGTENVPYILGLETAVKIIDFDKNNRIREVRDYCIEQLNCIPGTYLVGSRLNRLSNNINVCIKGVDAASLISYLDIYSIYVSGGSACDTGSYKPSHVLEAIELDKEDLHSCIRITIDRDITKDNIDYLVKIINQFLTRNRGELAE